MNLRVSTWTETALLRLGWALWVFQAVVLLFGIGLGLAAPASAADSSWGSSGFATEVAFLLLAFTFPCVGALIVNRQPRNRVGWLLLAGVGLAVALPGVLDVYALYGLAIDPGALPAAEVAAGIIEGSWVWMIGSVGIFLILLFPDGRLPSRRWRWLPWLAGTVMTLIAVSISLSTEELTEAPVPDLRNPLAVDSLQGPWTAVFTVVIVLLPVCIVAAAVSLVLRFRRSRGIERQQLKWLALAGAVVAACYFAGMAGQFLKADPFEGPDPSWLLVVQDLVLVSFALLPAAIGLAILRHRLYDIDRVINRTLVYGSLTLLLAATYLALVLGLRLLLDPLTGQSDLAVAASTLAVAALFRPARGRVQAVVDRRFFRGRYDAAQTVESFVGRLRQEVDLDAVSTDLRVVVDDTMQPAHVSLWLRKAP